MNLGSWLVLEQYMVPSIYAMVTGSPYGERQLLQARCSGCIAEARHSTVTNAYWVSLLLVHPHVAPYNQCGACCQGAASCCWL